MLNDWYISQPEKKNISLCFRKKSLWVFLSQFVWLVETSLCLICHGFVWCYRRWVLKKNVKFAFYFHRAVSVRTRTGAVILMESDHCLIFPKDVPNIDFLSHQCVVDPWDSWLLSWITSTSTTAKKNGDEDRTAASSHLPNIKCKRKLLQKNQCPAPARDVHNHEPWQSVSALLFSLLFLFYLVLRITCLTFMLRSKSFNVCSVVHNFECRTNGKRNGRKSEIIENVDAYSCVDFVTSANIHTQDLFVLINKFQRFGFMQARSALVRVRLP